MKQIYNFEQAAPPVLTETLLREKQAQKKQTRLLLAAGLLMELCMAVLAVLLFPASPLAASLCVAYVAASLAGSSVVALIFTKNRRFLVQ